MTSVRNQVLRALPLEERRGVLERCRRVELARGDVLVEGDTILDTVHFPEDAVVSSVAEYADGSIIEMATTGREGCTGIGLILGGDRSLSTLLTQVSGPAYAMDAADLAKSRDELPGFDTILFRFARAFVYQVHVSAACNGAHQLEQRLARWLLTMADRSDGPDLMLTHEFLAEMLGVQRPSLTAVAQSLSERGLIEYRRGRLTITNRPGLEAVSCECYWLVRRAYERLLPPADA